VSGVSNDAATTLLERELELNELANVVADAGRGQGRFVLVEAAAGLGKTTLLGAAAEIAARENITCLRARATELERDFAFGCVRQLLEPILAAASELDRNRLMDGAAALSTPLFGPDVGLRPPPSLDIAFSVLHGLYWLLSNLADERPVVLLMDDLQWSDAESLRFLNYLAPRLDGLRLAVFSTLRSGEDVPADLSRLATAPETTVLRPGPLSAEATAMVCRLRLGVPVADEFADACHESTGGNPYYLDALLRELTRHGIEAGPEVAVQVSGTGPAAVARAVLLRLAGRPAAATAVVRALAVLGDGATVREVARLADVAEAEAAVAADLLAALEILRPAERLEFSHPIVRDAVYADVGAHERSAVHARAALILAADRASEERIAAQIAEAEPAGDPERVELLRRVASRAIARGAPAAAAAMLRRALAEPPPEAIEGEVLFELGAAELRLAAPHALDHLAAAVELIREPELLATSVRWLANAWVISGNADGAVEAIESAIEILEPDDRELALRLEGSSPRRPCRRAFRRAIGRRGVSSDWAAPSRARPPASASCWQASPSSTHGRARRRVKPSRTSSGRSATGRCCASRTSTS
jgi:tetratricopeptide (TPR) repeat protein